jgi:4-carboxymuconolactone decarboxylase
VFKEQGIAHDPAPSPAWRTENPEGARYRAGWSARSHIDGHAGEQVIASLADLAPDLGRFIIEFAFGDVYTRVCLNELWRTGVAAWPPRRGLTPGSVPGQA